MNQPKLIGTGRKEKQSNTPTVLPNDFKTDHMRESFGSYVEACVYGNDLAKFLESTFAQNESGVEKEKPTTSVRSEVFVGDIATDIDAGYESDTCDTKEPEDAIFGLQFNNQVLPLMLEKQVKSSWLTTPVLNRYRMKKSNFMTLSHSHDIQICNTISEPNLPICQFRSIVSGYTKRIDLCKKHGISYAGGKQMQIRNLLDHFCEFHLWGDNELDEMEDMFEPHD